MTFRNKTTHWGLIAILLHFGVALAVFGLFALGWWMTDLTYYDSWYKTGPFIHKSIGLILFATVIFRLVWRVIDKAPEHLDSHARWERASASATHILLYLLMLVIMTSGYLISTADGRPISVFGWFDVPAVLSNIPGQADLAGAIHWYGALILMALVGLHIAGALKHHFIDKDTTLIRMFGKASR